MARVTPYMGIAKKHILVNVFFTSQFSYSPLVWMCHSRANNKINRIHDRCLQIVYNDKQSSFNESLEIDGSVLIHMRNIHILATKMYKLINKISPPIMNRVFKLNSDIRYNLRQILQFSRSQVRSVYHRTEITSYLKPKMWDILLDDCKTIGNLKTFKTKIKKMETRKLPV